jgi:hypothetical protein
MVASVLQYSGSASDLNALLRQLDKIDGLQITDRDVSDGGIEVKVDRGPELRALKKLAPMDGIEIVAVRAFDGEAAGRRRPLPRNYIDAPAMKLEDQAVVLDDDFKVKFLGKNKVEISLDGRKLLEAEVKDGKLHLTETDRKAGGGTETSTTTFDKDEDGSFTIKLPNAAVVLDSDGKGGEVIAGNQVAKVTSDKDLKLAVSDGGFEARQKLFDGIDSWIYLNGSSSPSKDDVALHLISVEDGQLSTKGLGKADKRPFDDGYLPTWGSPDWQPILLDLLTEQSGLYVDNPPKGFVDELRAGLQELRKAIQGDSALTDAQKKEYLTHYGIETEAQLETTARTTAQNYFQTAVQQDFLLRTLQNEYARDPASAAALLQALQQGAGSQYLGGLPSQFSSLHGDDGALAAAIQLQALLANQASAGAPIRNANIDPRAAALENIARRQAEAQGRGGYTAPSQYSLSQAEDWQEAVEILLSTRRDERNGGRELSKRDQTRLVDLIRGASPEEIEIGLGTLALAAAAGDKNAEQAIAAISDADRSKFSPEQLKAIEAALDSKLVDGKDKDSSSGAAGSGTELTGELKEIREDIVGLLPAHDWDRKEKLREVLATMEGRSAEEMAEIFEDLPPERKQRLFFLLAHHGEAIDGTLKQVSGELQKAINARRYEAGDVDAATKQILDNISNIVNYDSEGEYQSREAAAALETLARLDDASLNEVVDKVGFEKISFLIQTADDDESVGGKEGFEGYGSSIERIKKSRDRVRTDLSDTDVQEIAKRIDDRLMALDGGRPEVAKSVLAELTSLYSESDLVRIVHARGETWNADGDTFDNLYSLLGGDADSADALGKLTKALNTPLGEELSRQEMKRLGEQVKDWVAAHKTTPPWSEEGALEAMHALSALDDEQLKSFVLGVEETHLQRIFERMRPSDKDRYKDTMERLKKIADAEGMSVAAPAS